MLRWILCEWRFSRYIQSGLYIDYLIKKITEVFIKQLLIITAQFFGEKYIIEHYTKKIVEYSILNINKLYSLSMLNYFYYFLQLLGYIFYFLFVINILLII